MYNRGIFALFIKLLTQIMLTISLNENKNIYINGRSLLISIQFILYKYLPLLNTGEGGLHEDL